MLNRRRWVIMTCSHDSTKGVRTYRQTFWWFRSIRSVTDMANSNNCLTLPSPASEDIKWQLISSTSTLSQFDSQIRTGNQNNDSRITLFKASKLSLTQHFYTYTQLHKHLLQTLLQQQQQHELKWIQPLLRFKWQWIRCTQVHHSTISRPARILRKHNGRHVPISTPPLRQTRIRMDLEWTGGHYLCLPTKRR